MAMSRDLLCSHKWESDLNSINRSAHSPFTFRRMSDRLRTLQPMHIVLAGNSGTGKSSLLPYLAAALGFGSAPEPDAASRFLAASYRDPGRWAFTAQAEFMIRRAAVLRQAFTQAGDVVSDRSLVEDLAVFVAAWHRSGYIDNAESEVLEELFSLVSDGLPAPDLYVYLRADSATVQTRLRSRGPALQIPPAVLAERQALYETWLQSLREQRQPCSVLEVQTSEYALHELDKLAAQIASEISTLADAPTPQLLEGGND